MDSITFRTNDNSRWGEGNNADLTATQIDINFWVLYTALIAIQDHLDTSAGIASFTVAGDQFSVNLTNHVVLGPFTLPVAAFNFRGPWESHANYSINDVFTAEDVSGATAAFLVIWPQADSGATFFQYANDGNGHDYYAELIAAPPPELPDDGEPGQFLQWAGSPGAQWAYLTRNIGFYFETEPDPLEQVVRYIFTEATTFPEGLTGSQASAGTSPTGPQDYELYQNDASIGSVNFTASPDTPTFTFPHAITFEPGDILTVVAPSVPDPHMTLIAITLVGTLP